jgi:hypothetical protein
MAAELAWSGSTRRLSSEADANTQVRSSCRESVTYEDIAPQTDMQQKRPVNRRPKQFMSLVEMKHRNAGPPDNTNLPRCLLIHLLIVSNVFQQAEPVRFFVLCQN